MIRSSFIAVLASMPALPALAQIPNAPALGATSASGRPAFTPTPGVGATPGVIVVLESPSQECERNAKLAADKLTPAADALKICDAAIANPALDATGVAGALVNRGVLKMGMGDMAAAKADLGRALELDPKLAEAYVNRGAILVSEGKAREGVADLDKGIALGPSARAYYSRGLGREDLKDARGAYADYRMAAQLAPEWAQPLEELKRFSVAKK
jgi:tetratricopeptide (TPR) repeat protein